VFSKQEPLRQGRSSGGEGNAVNAYETVERVPLVIIKRDGTREPYDRAKLLNGIATACRKRPVTADRIESIVNDVEDILSDRYQTEIKSADIGRMVLERLLEIDEVSYVRFASVYRKFTNIDKFANELKKIKRERRWRKRHR